MAEHRVIIYTQDGCSGCQAEKQFLTGRRVKFEERNIAEDREYIEDMKKLGSSATPTTVVGDEVVIGFNRERLEELLNL